MLATVPKFFAVMVVAAAQLAGADNYIPTLDSGFAGHADFERYSTGDAFGRSITFFLSRTTDSRTLPIVAFIHGSGAYSNFLVKDGKVLSAHSGLLRRINGRARLLVVEKPGVRFGERHLVSELSEFRKQHTLDRWVEAITATLNASRTLRGIDRTRTILVGHSEGAEVVAAVAARNTFVTDVACLGGGSVARIYSFVRDARRGKMFGEIADPDQRVARFWEEWNTIQAHADDPDRLYHGHAYRYWTSFAGVSVLDGLSKAKGRVLIAEGSLDDDDPQFDIDLLSTVLRVGNRDVTAWLIQGANHGFQYPAAPERDGWAEIQKRVLDWAFGP